MNNIDTTPLLHNIGAPPRTVVRYSGLSNVAETGEGASDVRPAPSYGSPVRFVLPADVDTSTPTTILHSLGIDPGDDAHTTLESLINARANELPLPAGCAVIAAADTHRVIWADALSALAILTKCSDSIWLRAKMPAVHGAFTRRDATLLVPPAFAQQLEEKSP